MAVDNMPETDAFDAAGVARHLLRASRTGALATLEAATGAPFASLVTVATAFDGSPILLMSALSAHAQNLERDPRASLLLASTGRGDPLAHPRLTVIGRVERAEDSELRRRFLARHPKAALYADFGDFGFRRLEVESAHLNGGFARAARLPATEILSDVAPASPLREAEEGAVAHMNEDHADAVQLYATKLAGAPAGLWRLTGIDPDGCDLFDGEQTARLTFPAPVRNPSDLRRVLADLARQAREAG